MFDQIALESPLTCLEKRLKYHEDMCENVSNPEKKEFYLTQINNFKEKIELLKNFK